MPDREVQSRAADRNAIWDALPQSEHRAETAAEIADRAGVNRRSCGTKLTAMLASDYQALGLRRKLDRRDRRQYLWFREMAPSGAFDIDQEIVKVIAWCRIGGLQYRPASAAAFHTAKALGLLAQDDTWRATERGEGLLIAAGLLDGEPAPERTLVEVLWARSARYDRPQFVGAWTEGLSDCWPDEAARLRAEAEQGFRDFGDDGDWTFWTTFEHVDRPAQVREAVVA